MPSPLNYSFEQLRLEAGLLIAEFAAFVDGFTGIEDAGLHALNVQTGDDATHADREIAGNRYPNDFANQIERFHIWSSLLELHEYVQERRAPRTPDMTVLWVEQAVASVFSPPVVATFGREGMDLLGSDEILPPLPEEQFGQTDVGAYYMRLIPQLLAHGKARLKVDRGDDLTLAEIALLTGQKEQTVMTASHRSRFHTTLQDGRRLAKISDVLEYLIAYGYQPTQEPGGSTSSKNVSAEVLDEVVFVPVARDGTSFLPDVRINGRYVIGAKGDEQRVQDYFEALSLLQRMRVARWRRKGSAKAPGIVSGIRFERVAVKQINEWIAALR